MNPIVIIGLVSVVVAGMYAIYDGLEKQAELAALHADMLARQHAEHSVFVHGDITDGHIILVNNGPRPAELVQIRMYNASGGQPPGPGGGAVPTPLLNTWQVSHVIPPLGRLNLSDAAPPPPAGLGGGPLEDSLDNDAAYRGVTSSGGIFEIEPDASGGGAGGVPVSAAGGAGGVFGPQATLPIAGSGASVRHDGGLSAVSYYHAAGPHACKTYFVKPGESRYTVHDLYLVDRWPYSTSTAGVPGTPRADIGGPAYYDLVNSRPPPRHHDHIPNCDGFQAGLATVPSDITPLPGHLNVYHKVVHTTTTNVAISLPLRGDFTALRDGDMHLRVDIPVSAETRARYDASRVVDEKLMADNAARAHYPNPYNTAAALDEWKKLGSPVLGSSVTVRVNGSPAGTYDMSGLSASGGASFDGTPQVTRHKNLDGNTNGRTHTWILAGAVDGRWTHAGVLVGALTVNAAAGDRITLDGTVRLNYAPPAVSGAAVDTTHGSLEIGDAMVTAGIAPH